MSELAQDEYQGESPSKPLEITFAAIALAVSAGYLALAMRIPLRREVLPGQIDARFWPTLIAVAAIAASVALLVIAITRPAPTREDIERIQPGGVVRVVVTLALSAVFIALWAVGSVVLFGYRFELFPILAGLLTAALMLVYGHRRWLSLIIYSVSVAAFIYIVFGMLLRIPL